MYLVHTIDIKLASVLVASGIPLRKSDPITCFVEIKDGRRHEQYTFWFETLTEEIKLKAQDIMNTFWQFKEGVFLRDIEDPLYYMISALENREVFLHWIRSKVEPIKRVPFGNKDILLSERAKPALKEKLKQMAKGMS